MYDVSTMKVPILDLRAQYKVVGPAVEAAVRRVLESGHYILGEDVGAFEKEMAAFSGTTDAVAMSSGTDALLAALMALGIGPGDEVVTTSMSFFATAGAIARLGAKPVFADIEAHSYNMDPRDAMKRVTARTKAIVPVHLFGRPADLGPYVSTGIPIVEDAAQALGAPLCKPGAMASLSFFPSKNLGAAGDAGMVLTNDAALADKLRLLRAHGSRPKYVHHIVGANFRMDTMQAAILRAKLPYLKQWNDTRRKNVERYRSLLAGTPLTMPEEGAGQVWHHFVVRAPRRDELKKHLAAREIDTEVYYPGPLHLQPCFASLGGKEGDLPEAERMSKEVLAFPIHPELSNDQIDFVAAAVKEFYK